MKRTHDREQEGGNCRHGIPPLTRRLSLRLRCARPGHASGYGQEPETPTGWNQFWSGLMSWRRAARFRRTLVGVKRKPRSHSAGPSSLERGSAASNRGQVLQPVSQGTENSRISAWSTVVDYAAGANSTVHCARSEAEPWKNRNTILLPAWQRKSHINAAPHLPPPGTWV